MGRWISLGTAAVAAALLSGCGFGALGQLRYAPGDLSRATKEMPELPSPPSAAGRIERELHEAARRQGRPELLIDTTDPRDDAKLRARACDAGDAEACGELGGYFLFLLREPRLGLELWVAACEGGVADRCADAADLYGREGVPVADAERARSLDLRSCTTGSQRPYACRRAAPLARFRHERYLLLDRGCELGDGPSCREILKSLRRVEAPLLLLEHYKHKTTPTFTRVVEAPVVPETPGGFAKDAVSVAKRERYRALREADARAIADAAMRRVIGLRLAANARARASGAAAARRTRHASGPMTVGGGPIGPWLEIGLPAEACLLECGNDEPRCACRCLEERGVDAEVRAVGERCVADLARLPATIARDASEIDR